MDLVFFIVVLSFEFYSFLLQLTVQLSALTLTKEVNKANNCRALSILLLVQESQVLLEAEQENPDYS